MYPRGTCSIYGPKPELLGGRGVGLGGEKFEKNFFHFFFLFFQWKMLNLCLNEWKKLFLLHKWVTKLTFYDFEDVWLDFF